MYCGGIKTSEKACRLNLLYEVDYVDFGSLNAVFKFGDPKAIEVSPL